jgi:hypothetical protein
MFAEEFLRCDGRIRLAKRAASGIPFAEGATMPIASVLSFSFRPDSAHRQLKPAELLH